MSSQLSWPNRITLARILLIPAWVILLLNIRDGELWARRGALVLFVLMAASDALDGFLARRLGQQTALGRFLDPLADKLLTTCAVVILAVEATSEPSARLPAWVAVVALGKDVLTVVGFLLLYLATQQVLIRPRAWGKACTMIQSIMVAGTLAAPEFPTWSPVVMPVLWVVSSAAAVLALGDYILMGLRFAAEHACENQRPAEPDE